MADLPDTISTADDARTRARQIVHLVSVCHHHEASHPIVDLLDLAVDLLDLADTLEKEAADGSA